MKDFKLSLMFSWLVMGFFATVVLIYSLLHPGFASVILTSF